MIIARLEFNSDRDNPMDLETTPWTKGVLINYYSFIVLTTFIIITRLEFNSDRDNPMDTRTWHKLPHASSALDDLDSQFRFQTGEISENIQLGVRNIYMFKFEL